MNWQVIRSGLFLGITCFMLTICFGCGGADVKEEEAAATIDPAVIAMLDADYYIDYAGGTVPINDLPIGARVVDPSWEWEFRIETHYTHGRGEEDQTKSVTWLIVAKDHYEGLGPHVTLLSEELIGRFPFDDNIDRGSEYGSNHWGNSGNTNDGRGLRPWLNSTGIHSGEGFYRAFSEGFKQAVLTTTVPHKKWQSGSAYSTSDNVFIPSATELGDTTHHDTYPIGTAYAYFKEANNNQKVAILGGEAWWYWTRSPDSNYGFYVLGVERADDFGSDTANSDLFGVRPVLNLKAGTLVSEIKH